MKGLIIKDVMCMKKQLIIFGYVLISVICISVMYVLSIRCGNLALGVNQIMAEEQLSASDLKNLGKVALVTFMLLPLATVGDLARVFEADGKAGFARMAGVLPVPLPKRILARFLTVYTLFAIGVLVDTGIALLLSMITDMIRFGELFGIIISAASVLIIYCALLIFFCILLGYGKEGYAQIFALLTMMFTAIVCNFDRLKKTLVWIMESENGNTGGQKEMSWGLLMFIEEKYWVLFLIAFAVSLLSYGASCLVAERKREVI